MSLSAIFTLFLNTCREGDSTTSQGFSQKELYHVYIGYIYTYTDAQDVPTSPS